MHKDLEVLKLEDWMINSQTIQSFNCGSEAWEEEVSEWLKSPDRGAIKDIKETGTTVNLYFASSELVGVGAFGRSQISWPKSTDKRRDCYCITNIGVNKSHVRNGYGQTILNHILTEIEVTAKTDPLVVTLYVHIDNSVAIGWYEKNGFKVISKKPYLFDGKCYHTMARCLKSPAAGAE